MPDVAAPPIRASARRAHTHELTWRLILDEPRSGASNMALDHALAARLRPGRAVLRLYGWSTPTVSFGKNEPARRIDAGTHAYVRRPTGGRAVLHAEELTYAVVAPLDAFGGLREAYRRINETLAEALRTLGATVAVASSGRGDQARAPGPDAGPCFRIPAPGEIMSGGRKLVGSAQARLEGALLQHGAILLGGDQSVLGESGGEVTLGELLGRVRPETVADAAADACRVGFGGEWAEGGYEAGELEAAERLEADRYSQDTWTWRR